MTPRLLHERSLAGTASTDFSSSDAHQATTRVAIAAVRQIQDVPECKGRDSSEIATELVRKPDLQLPVPFLAIGDQFQGFEILSELGRGAMGRVFLARQQAPTERTVVLKFGEHLSGECQKLAKLQHPNIVPVYSYHEFDRMQAVCMPYRGPLTMGHLIARLRSEHIQTLDGRSLTTMIEQCREDRKSSIANSAKSSNQPIDSTKHSSRASKHNEQEITNFAGLYGLSFVDSVLTIIRQVVDGLRFAHSERIVHCDLKPANVLIADDGCAQLIDFGISLDKSRFDESRERIGGTRPYMSPEQLQSFLTGTLQHDERSDLYAVGVILYEMLTGQVPYASDFDSSHEGIRRELESRFVEPAGIRSFNQSVPFAVESIVDKCLAPDIANRYQSANDLLEDLDCQIGRRALCHAPNTSQLELCAKWLVRHRLFVAVAALLTVTGGVSTAFWKRDSVQAQEIRQLELISAAEPFTNDLEEAEFAFGMADSDPTYREEAWKLARRALDRFGAWSNSEWYELEEFQRLPSDRLELYRQKAAGLMLLLANSQAQQAIRSTSPDERTTHLDNANEWNRRAKMTHPAPEGCRAVWIQLGFLSRIVGDPARAEQYSRCADSLPSEPADTVLEGRQFMTEGRIQSGLKALQKASESDPKNFWAVFYSSVCHHMLSEYLEAVQGYDICSSLRPGFFGTEYNRGLSHLRLGRPKDAEADFDRALKARPNWTEALFQRAIAREVQKNYTGAIDDLNRALKQGFTPTSIHLVRSRVHGRMGDKKSAEADFSEGMKIVPTDERGWLARAQAQLFRNPKVALADYDQALRLNPRLIPALQGQAHILSKASKNDEALKAVTKIIDINPDSPDAWSGRGVLRARLNDRPGALADGREALRLTKRPSTLYQVAGIYAMTSRTHPEDRREAFSLLDRALREGFGFEHLADDHELDPIRSDTEFKKTVDAARKYRESLKTVN